MSAVHSAANYRGNALSMHDDVTLIKEHDKREKREAENIAADDDGDCERGGNDDG